ncbi:MAG: hypothetical protein ACP5PM_06315 [Acidimicrobiales bacterium]
MGSPSPAVAHLQDGLTKHLAALQEAHQRWPTFITILDVMKERSAAPA